MRKPSGTSLSITVIAATLAGGATAQTTITPARYSPLDLIHRGDVAGLKGAWRTGLESGTGPGNSAQAQILVFEGDGSTHLLGSNR